MSNFDFDPLTTIAKNSPNSGKSNGIFPGKGRGDRALILTYMDSSMAEVFLDECLFFLILVIFSRKPEVKVGPKVQTLGPSFFHKNTNLSFGEKLGA